VCVYKLLFNYYIRMRVCIFTKPVGGGERDNRRGLQARVEIYKKRRSVDRRRRVGSFNGQAAAAIGTLSAAIKIILSLLIYIYSLNMLINPSLY